MRVFTYTSDACRRCSARTEISCSWMRLVAISPPLPKNTKPRSEEHTSELQSLMRISYAVFCLQTKKYRSNHKIDRTHVCTQLTHAQHFILRHLNKQNILIT